MSSRLVACASCGRHVFASEAKCPFCASALSRRVLASVVTGLTLLGCPKDPPKAEPDAAVASASASASPPAPPSASDDGAIDLGNLQLLGHSDGGLLRERAAVWGAQLAAAGVTVNLAPVADIVTSPDVAEQNAPIGALLRNYGYDAATVAAQAGAFADGMRRAGVMPTFKHFPGLGRTTENTDDAAGVVDAVIDARSPDVEVYRDLLAGGPAIVMVSLATYQGIDPAAPAVFSPIVVDDLLRDAIGHEGVVMTDDLSATASVAGVPPADRALRAIEAGVDVVLVSADPAVFAEMYDAVLARAESDPAFAAVVDAAARRVVDAKLAGP